MVESGDDSSNSSSSSDTLLVRKQRLLGSGVVAKKKSPLPQAPDAICDKCEGCLDSVSIILSCTGPCFRKYHIACCPNEIQSSSWQCVECRTSSHRCFICQDVTHGSEGSSTVPCRAAGCGKFYHVSCVKRLPLTRLLDNTSFICPLHTCHKCEGSSQGEATQAIRCTRCPRAYHVTCFPPSGFDRLCQTRGICHAHRLSAAVQKRLSTSSIDSAELFAESDNDRTQAVSSSSGAKKKDKKRDKKKKKKKKQRKKSKSSKGGSVADSSDDDDESHRGDVKVEMPSNPLDEKPVVAAAEAPKATSVEKPPIKPLNPAMEKASEVIALAKTADVVATPPPPSAPDADKPSKLELNITIPDKDGASETAEADAVAAKAALSARNKKKKKKKRTRGTTTPTADALDETEEAKWVQCDSCKKWRTVPQELDLDAMSDKAWYCKMNHWDAAYASCDVPEEVVEPKAKKPKIEPADAPSPVIAPPPPVPSPPLPVPAATPKPLPKAEPEKKEAKLSKKQQARLKVQQKQAAKAQQGAAAAATPAAMATTAHKEIEWVQCESVACGKWRVVPPTIDIASLPIKWYCSLNTWAPELATCAAENPSDVVSLLQHKSGGAKPSKPTPPANAATSTRSGKASPRGLNVPIPTVTDIAHGDVDSPLGKGGNKKKSPEKAVLEWAQCEKCNKWRKLPAHVKSANLPDKWFCSMNHWNPAVASCSVPEETDHDPVPARVPLPIGPRPKRGKLSYRELLYAGNGHLRKAYTEESSTLSFEFEGKLYHRDDQYRNSSLYLAPTSSAPVDDLTDASTTVAEDDPMGAEVSENDPPTTPALSRADEERLKFLLQEITKADGGTSVVDMVAALHSDAYAARTGGSIFTCAAVRRSVASMVADGSMEEFRDERLVTVTVPTQISSYAHAYYVCGENNTELRSWEERRTRPEMLYRRKLVHKLPLKVAKPWKQKGFAGWPPASSSS
ncbi:Aste57867_21419 [Aphanomyces stellatus]|uniref:Aste57867_21419 protein n=1 Tax=Aphanomyces stellatus TaxID=120398 RepID=A0A485LHI4_9STRA|nr:hypothetical protein As57867_021350 [Aphanomyces stellatus]VFT98090.1 Aste57867_21419 [Aphanomyces stellatus]